MNKKLQIVALVVVIVALLLCISVDLLPKAGQRVSNTVQNVETKTTEAVQGDKYISFVKNDEWFKAVLTQVGSTSVLSYEVRSLLTTDDSFPASVAVKYLGPDSQEHEIVVFPFTLEGDVQIQTYLTIDGLGYSFTTENGLYLINK